MIANTRAPMVHYQTKKGSVPKNTFRNCEGDSQAQERVVDDSSGKGLAAPCPSGGNPQINGWRMCIHRGKTMGNKDMQYQ